jgi:hypothetical protein
MPAIYALPAFFLRGESVSLAYGVFQFLTSLGLAAQSLIGFTIDRTGGYAMGYGLMMSFFAAALLCAVMILALRRKDKTVYKRDI